MHKPTEESKELVDRWVRNGIPRLLIAESLNISYTTLMKHYRNEIKTAEANAVIEVANHLYQMATTFIGADSRGLSHQIKLKAIMYWLDRRGGEAWKPTAQIPYVKTIAEVKEDDVRKEALDPILFLTQELRPYEKGESKYIDPPKK